MNIEIYGAEWCSYCKKAELLCKTKLVDYVYFDVDDEKNLVKLEEKLGAKVKSIPQIFKDGLLVPGGFSGLQQELAKTN
jgi:glutaredoxin